MMITDAAKVSLVYAPGSLFVVSDLYSAAFARVVQHKHEHNNTTCLPFNASNFSCKENHIHVSGNTIYLHSS